MGVECGEHGEYEETGEKDQYRRYYLNKLDQYAGQCPSQRLEAEGEEAKDESTFFQLTKLHTRFERFWRASRNPYRRQFESRLRGFRTALGQAELPS